MTDGGLTNPDTKLKPSLRAAGAGAGAVPVLSLACCRLGVCLLGAAALQLAAGGGGGGGARALAWWALCPPTSAVLLHYAQKFRVPLPPPAVAALYLAHVAGFGVLLAVVAAGGGNAGFPPLAVLAVAGLAALRVAQAVAARPAGALRLERRLFRPLLEPQGGGDAGREGEGVAAATMGGVRTRRRGPAVGPGPPGRALGRRPRWRGRAVGRLARAAAGRAAARASAGRLRRF